LGRKGLRTFTNVARYVQQNAVSNIDAISTATQSDLCVCVSSPPPGRFVDVVSDLQSGKPEGGITKTCTGFSLVRKTRLLMLHFKTERLLSRGIKAVHTGSVWFARRGTCWGNRQVGTSAVVNPAGKAHGYGTRALRSAICPLIEFCPYIGSALLVSVNRIFLAVILPLHSILYIGCLLLLSYH